MNINVARMKVWDWGVVAAFVVTIIGVSIPWWALKDVGGSLNGWDTDAGTAAFVFALFALVWVAVKMLLPADRPLPKWYMEAWPVLVIGAICVICGLVGTADKPGDLGFGEILGSIWAWRPGGLITLIAGLGLVLCGYMMLKDKSGDYGVSTMPKITTSGGPPPGGGAPPAGGPPSGGTPPAAQ